MLHLDQSISTWEISRPKVRIQAPISISSNILKITNRKEALIDPLISLHRCLKAVEISIILSIKHHQKTLKTLINPWNTMPKTLRRKEILSRIPRQSIVTSTRWTQVHLWLKICKLMLAPSKSWYLMMVNNLSQRYPPPTLLHLVSSLWQTRAILQKTQTF